MSVVKKKKHVSKKNKRDWRKHCDIRDVEEFMEEQRLEERLGKFDTKADSELFVVDIAGELKSEDVKPLSAKLKKRAKITEVPKCFEILLPSSKVEDPNKKRNRVNPVGSKPTALSKLTEKRRFEKGVYQKKIEDARKNRRLAVQKKRKAKQIRQTFDLDLWGKDLPESKSIPSLLEEEFISPEAKLHNVLPDQRLRPKPPPPKTIATRAAVVAPHPGASYNPTFQEHQELLQNVVEHEKKMIKREEHLNRVTTRMFKRVTAQQKENQWQEEMSEGLPKPHNPAEDQQSETDDEYKAINPPVKNKKKDHKARRKQREQIAEKERLKREKIDKKKITDIYRLRKLETSISKREKKQQQLKVKRAAKLAEQAATAIPMLNAHKTTPKEPDFVEAEQLTGNLLNINSKTNLLRERFESLQQRGALAASKVMMRKKRKLKSYFKPGHKVTDQEIEKYINKIQPQKLVTSR